MTTTATIEAWLKKHVLVFQYRLENSVFHLKELASGKTYIFDSQRIAKHRLTPHPQGMSDYLNLIYDNGSEFVLCDAGLAFSPDYTNTGPLPDAPAVVCMMDYYQMFNHLVDLTTKDDFKHQTLLLFQVLIATLDGAKKIGLDVSLEEETLDKKLTEFETSLSA